MIISAKQQEANRQNAQHSTGPKTPEGKAAIRFNALTYGLRTRFSILPDENAAERRSAARSVRDALTAASESDWVNGSRTAGAGGRGTPGAGHRHT